MFLHSNDIIHGKLNSENIFIHNGNIKFNVFGLTKIMPESLKFLTNSLGPIQYIDSQYLEIFNTIDKNKKGKREIEAPGTPSRYKEIYTDCWKHNGNLRPDILQVVKNLSEIIISDSSFKKEIPQSQFHNVTDEIISVKLEKLNIQSEELKVLSDPPFVNKSAEFEVFIKELFEIFIDIIKKQFTESQPIMMKNYIKEHKKNPVKVLYEMIRHPSHSWFTSMIGYFYENGIGTVTDNQMAFKFFSMSANEVIDASSSNSSSLIKLYNFNKEIGTILLADMYLDGKVADCYENGFGVEINEEKAFKLSLKSAETGLPVALRTVGWCYVNGFGTRKDTAKGFQWYMKSALAGNIISMWNVGCFYLDGIGVDRDYQEAFKWILKAAEKGEDSAQSSLGNCYKIGYGITTDQVKAFEWYKKAAECGDIDGQYEVGKCLYEGRGTKKDIINAIYWLNKAKENEDIDADELLVEIINNIR
ncbi:hypothetical protein Glove_29g139 [Diversispora epigaea]|uniref:Protein kinase domain-containing protein n=1 Tax=Diversispora epigaea TaxID=1348612 RepID=A0A397JU37_9GLOM|nr:hypothetical protein Glove_29g139 [Diversispora epigaea]